MGTTTKEFKRSGKPSEVIGTSGLSGNLITLSEKDSDLPPLQIAFRDSKRKVLDKGFVRLVDYMGGDGRVVQTARVSYGDGTTTRRKDSKLIHYLQENLHTSPSENVIFTFHVKAPIFVFRQWHRHRTWSYNEQSARYSEMTDEFYVPELSRLQKQDGKNRQASATETVDYPESVQDIIIEACKKAYLHYQALLASGLSRELARVVLPVNYYSEMYATVDANNLFKFLSLRMDTHAQWEIQQYAKALYELAKPVAPTAFEAWEKQQNDYAEYKKWRESNGN